MSWPRAHWLVGLLTLVLFVSAGVYMRYVILVPQMEDAPRMIFRSRFLFLLLAALANFAMSGVRPTGVIQKVASTLILAAPLPLITSFLFDASRGVRSSPWTVWTMRSLFLAALLLAFVNRPKRPRV